MATLHKIEDLAAALPKERTNALKVTVLVDNNADGKHFLPEHGLSMLLEVAGRHILFDTGAGEALDRNARRLRVDVVKLTDIVVSHSHYDHTGGIPAILELNPASGSSPTPSCSRRATPRARRRPTARSA